MTQQCINDKSVADTVEALIGAHLTSLGLSSTLKFMEWLGIKVMLGPRKPDSPLLQFMDTEEDVSFEYSKTLHISDLVDRVNSPVAQLLCQAQI